MVFGLFFWFIGSDCHFSPDARVQNVKMWLKVPYVIYTVCYLSVRMLVGAAFAFAQVFTDKAFQRTVCTFNC